MQLINIVTFDNMQLINIVTFDIIIYITLNYLLSNSLSYFFLRKIVNDIIEKLIITICIEL